MSGVKVEFVVVVVVVLSIVVVVTVVVAVATVDVEVLSLFKTAGVDTTTDRLELSTSLDSVSLSLESSKN